MALIDKLENITDLSSVDQWMRRQLKDLPTPEIDFPESYKWNDNDPKKGLHLNKAGKNSAVAQILKEAQDRRKAIAKERKAKKEDGGDPRKSAKLQVGGRSVEAASSMAYPARLEEDGNDAQMEGGEEGAQRKVPQVDRVQDMFFAKVAGQKRN